MTTHSGPAPTESPIPKVLARPTEHEKANRSCIDTALRTYRASESDRYITRFAEFACYHLIMRQDVMNWIYTGDDPEDTVTSYFLRDCHAYAAKRITP